MCDIHMGAGHLCNRSCHQAVGDLCAIIYGNPINPCSESASAYLPKSPMSIG